MAGKGTRIAGAIVLSLAAGCTAARPPDVRRPGVGPPTPGDVVLDPGERANEARWLASLGVRAPADGALLERPFAAPFGPRSFVVPAAWYRAPPPRDVDPRALRLDLSVLAEALPRVYAGYERAEKRGFRFAAWLARWRADLDAAGDRRLPAADAFAPMAELMQAQLDNRTGPLLPRGFGSGSATAELEPGAGPRSPPLEEPGAPCTRMRVTSGEEFALDPGDPAQQPKEAAAPDARGLRRAAYLAYPARRGELTAVFCGARWIQPVAAEPATIRDRFVHMLGLLGRASEREDAPGFARLAPDVAYLRVPSLSREAMARLEALAAELPAGAGRERALVVDLRFNEGGDGGVRLPVLDRYAGGAIEAAAPRRLVKRSCLADAMRWGSMQRAAVAAPARSPDLARALQAELDAAPSPMPPGCPAALEETPATFAYADRVIDPSRSSPLLLVLVNEHCTAECELAAYAIASSRNAVVAGVNTFGAIQFGDPRITVLPRTRVPFRIAGEVSDPYGDGRSVDGYGLDVDVLLTRLGDTSAEALVALARSLSPR